MKLSEVPSDFAEIDPDIGGDPTPPPRSVRLTRLEQWALHAGMLTDDPVRAEFEGLVVRSAEALAGSDRTATRNRLVGKALAMTRMRVLALETLLMDKLSERDVVAVALVSKVLEGAHRRFVALAAEHRYAAEAERRPTVSVAVEQRGVVNVVAVAGRT
jgi:hypothetical protein